MKKLKKEIKKEVKKEIKITEKDVVSAFASGMLQKLEMRHNRYMPFGWATMNEKRLTTLLIGELNELNEAIKSGVKADIRDEAIDVANYCMFIWAKNNEPQSTDTSEVKK